MRAHNLWFKASACAGPMAPPHFQGSVGGGTSCARNLVHVALDAIETGLSSKSATRCGTSLATQILSTRSSFRQLSSQHSACGASRGVQRPPGLKKLQEASKAPCLQKKRPTAKEFVAGGPGPPPGSPPGRRLKMWARRLRHLIPLSYLIRV